MKRIGVLSDTHGFIAPQIYTFFKDCDELWHAGDCGLDVLEELQKFKPIRAVYGNMDNYDMRYTAPKTNIFDCDGLHIMMTHIGGWPGHYPATLRQELLIQKPDIFVCGHSHILKVMYDKELNFLHINPGAAGIQGFHKTCTLVRFVIDKTPQALEIMDFPKSKKQS